MAKIWFGGKTSKSKFWKMIIPKYHNSRKQNLLKSGLLFRKNFLRTGITNIFNLNTIYGDEWNLISG